MKINQINLLTQSQIADFLKLMKPLLLLIELLKIRQTHKR